MEIFLLGLFIALGWWLWWNAKFLTWIARPPYPFRLLKVGKGLGGAALNSIFSYPAKPILGE
jgi:hypothetical protein